MNSMRFKTLRETGFKALLHSPPMSPTRVPKGSISHRDVGGASSDRKCRAAAIAFSLNRVAFSSGIAPRMLVMITVFGVLTSSVHAMDQEGALTSKSRSVSPGAPFGKSSRASSPALDSSSPRSTSPPAPAHRQKSQLVAEAIKRDGAYQPLLRRPAKKVSQSSSPANGPPSSSPSPPGADAAPPSPKSAAAADSSLSLSENLYEPARREHGDPSSIPSAGSLERLETPQEETAQHLIRRSAWNDVWLEWIRIGASFTERSDSPTSPLASPATPGTPTPPDSPSSAASTPHRSPGAAADPQSPKAKGKARAALIYTTTTAVTTPSWRDRILDALEAVFQSPEFRRNDILLGKCCLPAKKRREFEKIKARIEKKKLEHKKRRKEPVNGSRKTKRTATDSKRRELEREKPWLAKGRQTVIVREGDSFRRRLLERLWDAEHTSSTTPA